MLLVRMGMYGFGTVQIGLMLGQLLVLKDFRELKV